MKFQNVNGRRYYEENEKQWLREHYGSLSCKELTRQFNDTFNHNKTVATLKRYCERWLSLKFDGDKYADRRSPKGSIMKNIRGDYFIKTEKGWEKLTHHICGHVPKGYVVIHLNGNKHDNRKENLMAVRNGIQTIMRNAGICSTNIDISRTSVMWAELYSALKKAGYDVTNILNDERWGGRV